MLSSVVRNFGSAAGKVWKGGAKPNVAVVGATGAVGNDLLRVLEQRSFPVNDIKLLASARSKGKQLGFAGEQHTVQELTQGAFEDVDIALFSAGGDRSKEFAPAAVEAGAVVVDNSSAYRMHPDVPLVVPEVNPDDARAHKGIIANPNCSTIIMAVPLWPLHKAFGIERLVVSTYQAASGAGAAAMDELADQAKCWAAGKPVDQWPQDIWGRQYAFNLFSHDSPIEDNLYNQEEMKMVNETGKIFHDSDIRVTATCIRVPVLRAHCEDLNIQFRSNATAQDVRDALQDAPGVKIVDDPRSGRFPEPIGASGQDDVLVGRIRGDVSLPPGQGVNMFIAGDQLLKGAATNAVQIAELLL